MAFSLTHFAFLARFFAATTHPSFPEPLTHPWQLKNVEVNAYEDTITFNMDPKSLEDAPLYMFLCSRKEDLANIIASYSPAHRNWKQVCPLPWMN